MLKDIHIRILFIPVIGIFLPALTGIITYRIYATPVMLLSILYFILVVFVTWTACHWMHRRIRALFSPLSHLARRIIAITFSNTLCGTCMGCLAVLGWMQFSSEIFDWNNIIRFVLACATVVMVLTLVYEILFLTREREQDIRTVNLLGRERMQAELQVLRNEMDPHFLFNGLNTLDHLILTNPSQARAFNNKLAQVYKYFLVNKDKELIPLTSELDFLEDYFFLLRLRYENKLQLEVQLDIGFPANVKIPPCSLQILVENAIKHNSFSDAEPLHIVIRVSNQYIRVVNRVKPKPYIPESTRIGLNNLSSRYKLLFNKDIIVNPGKENFVVNLPVIR